MTRDEARAAINSAVEEQAAAYVAYNNAIERTVEVANKAGLVALGLNVGDVIVCDGKRWSVTGARLRHGCLVLPLARLILKNGALGRELPHVLVYGWKKWKKEE